MSFDAFIEAAWADHADRPQDVADRLSSSLHLVATPAQVAPFARLATHVFGEHLGQWARGIEVLDSLRSLPAFDGDPATTDALVRNVAALRYASGDQGASTPLPAENRASALGIASSALAGRSEFGRAIAAYAEAMRVIPVDLPANSPANRALAVAGNNLASALEAKPHRDAAETQGMIAAAEGGLKYWRLAGTWLEEERAEYRLTRSLLQAKDGAAAVQSARRCIAVCDAHDAPAFEQFFGHAVLALALRATGDAEGFAASRAEAMRLYALVEPGEQPWCKAELAELDG